MWVAYLVVEGLPHFAEHQWCSVFRMIRSKFQIFEVQSDGFGLSLSGNLFSGNTPITASLPFDEDPVLVGSLDANEFSILSFPTGTPPVVTSIFYRVI